jgi:hypothetical protein
MDYSRWLKGFRYCDYRVGSLRSPKSTCRRVSEDGRGSHNHVGYGVAFDAAGGDSVRVAAAINKMSPASKAKVTGPTRSGPNTRSVYLYLYAPDGIYYLQIVAKEDDGWLPSGPAGKKILGEKG